MSASSAQNDDPSRAVSSDGSEAEPNVLLAADDLTKHFGSTRALDGASLRVRAGEVHGLVGANGAGKSTLIKLLCGAQRPDAGSIRIGPWQGQSLTPRQAQRLGVTTLHQDPSLVPTLGLVENVELGREATIGRVLLAKRLRNESAKTALERVGLDPDSRVRAGGLTPAQQQLLQIAKALRSFTRVLLLDEPTAALGGPESEKLFDLVDSLRRAGVAMVYVSHRLEEVLSVCDRVTVMRDGRSVMTASAQELTEDTLIRAMTGSKVSRVTVHPNTRGRLALAARGVSKRQALHDISFELFEGEVVGLTGLIGSGRSRLGRVLFGAESFDSGEIEVYGASYKPRSPAAAIRQGVGLVPQDRLRESLLLNLSTAKNISLARMKSRLGVMDLRRELRIAAALIERLDVRPNSPRTWPRNLSGGNQQKVSIARWLNAGSQVLIFDEPGQGVDVGAKERILAEIRTLAREGRAVLVISAEFDELTQVADRVLVMAHGAIVGELDRADLSEEAVLQLALGQRKTSAAVA